MQKITTYLWFDNKAEEAMNFYTSVFNEAPGSSNNSKIDSIARYPENSEEEHLKGMGGKVIHGVFELAGQRFLCLDGGPQFKFNESISLYVDCDSQEEVDYFWDKLSAAPDAEACGWLKDKYGLSWQIIPKQLEVLMGNPDPKKSQAVIHAMLQMKKIVVADLQQASDEA